MHYLIVLFLFCSTTLFAKCVGIKPEEALERLQQGNARFVKDRLEHPDRSSIRRVATAPQQCPFAIILGCSDSRVSPEILFDQGIGDIFVVRVAGNVVGPLELDSIEYALLHYGSAIIMVLGHENCGAVKAVFEKDTQEIEAIAQLIQPAIQGAKNVEEAVKSNIEAVVKFLKNSPLIEKFMKEKAVDVVGAYYDLTTGQVNLELKEPQ